MIIEKKHVSDQVLVHLRKEIMVNSLKEGDHLKENELSKSLNVSRGPIREAIAVLESERLVKTPSNGRTIVRGFGVKDVKDLYDSRILLETHALTQIKPAILEKGIKQLYDYISQMQMSHDRGIRDVEIDMNFHGYLVKMTNNQTLIQLWLSLNGKIETLIDVTSSFVVSHQQQVIEQHKSIVDVLKNNNVEGAQNDLSKHLNIALDYYCQAMEEIKETRKG